MKFNYSNTEIAQAYLDISILLMSGKGGLDNYRRIYEIIVNAPINIAESSEFWEGKIRIKGLGPITKERVAAILKFGADGARQYYRRKKNEEVEGEPFLRRPITAGNSNISHSEYKGGHLDYSWTKKQGR